MADIERTEITAPFQGSTTEVFYRAMLLKGYLFDGSDVGKFPFQSVDDYQIQYGGSCYFYHSVLPVVCGGLQIITIDQNEYSSAIEAFGLRSSQTERWFTPEG